MLSGAVRSPEAGRHCPGGQAALSPCLLPASHPHMPILTFRPEGPWGPAGPARPYKKISRAGNKGPSCTWTYGLTQVFHPMWGLMPVPCPPGGASPPLTGAPGGPGSPWPPCGRKTEPNWGAGSQSYPSRETEAGLPIVGGAIRKGAGFWGTHRWARGPPWTLQTLYREGSC